MTLVLYGLWPYHFKPAVTHSVCCSLVWHAQCLPKDTQQSIRVSAQDNEGFDNRHIRDRLTWECRTNVSHVGHGSGCTHRSSVSPTSIDCAGCKLSPETNTSLLQRTAACQVTPNSELNGEQVRVSQ